MRIALQREPLLGITAHFLLIKVSLDFVIKRSQGFLMTTMRGVFGGFPFLRFYLWLMESDRSFIRLLLLLYGFAERSKRKKEGRNKNKTQVIQV
jgi:hypothetical protein